MTACPAWCTADPGHDPDEDGRVHTSASVNGLSVAFDDSEGAGARAWWFEPRGDMWGATTLELGQELRTYAAELIALAEMTEALPTS